MRRVEGRRWRVGCRRRRGGGGWRRKRGEGGRGWEEVWGGGEWAVGREVWHIVRRAAGKTHNDERQWLWPRSREVIWWPRDLENCQIFFYMDRKLLGFSEIWFSILIAGKLQELSHRQKKLPWFSDLQKTSMGFILKESCLGFQNIPGFSYIKVWASTRK